MNVIFCQKVVSTHATLDTYVFSPDVSASIRMCADRQLHLVFIYTLTFFHNGRMQRTLETVCVIDDKTKHSAR